MNYNHNYPHNFLFRKCVDKTVNCSRPGNNFRKIKIFRRSFCSNRKTFKKFLQCIGRTDLATKMYFQSNLVSTTAIVLKLKVASHFSFLLLLMQKCLIY